MVWSSPEVGSEDSADRRSVLRIVRLSNVFNGGLNESGKGHQGKSLPCVEQLPPRCKAKQRCI